MSWSREFSHGDEAVRVTCRPDGQRWSLQIDERSVAVEAWRLADGRVAFELDGRRHVASAVRHAAGADGSLQVRVDGRTYVLPGRSRSGAASGGAASGEVKAPMTGTVLDVLVEVGQDVAVGDPVAIVTAMKMEHKLVAEIEGKVREVAAAVGDNVDQGALLVRIE